MKRVVTAVVLLALLAATAWAQEAGGSGAALPSGYTPHTFGGYGFSLVLPDSGTLTIPGSADWKEDPAVAFEWRGGADDPVVLIQGRVDRFNEVALDAATFDAFCNTLLQNWSEDPAKYKVVTRNRRFEIAPFTWNLIEVEDYTKGTQPGQLVSYSVFCTYQADAIYTLTMYYLTPVATGSEVSTVQEFGKPVLYSLNVT